MKTIIFILLKIAEICLIPLAVYLMWFIGSIFRPEEQVYRNILFGLLIICIIGAISTGIYLIYLVAPDFFKRWIALNKRWSEKITTWIKTH